MEFGKREGPDAEKKNQSGKFFSKSWKFPPLQNVTIYVILEWIFFVWKFLEVENFHLSVKISIPFIWDEV